MALQTKNAAGHNRSKAAKVSAPRKISRLTRRQVDVRRASGSIERQLFPDGSFKPAQICLHENEA